MWDLLSGKKGTLNKIISYKYSYFRRDLGSAVTVALLALPQSMAYALVAGLPPAVGVASAVFATLFCALFGSSRHLVSGPTNAMAILLQSAIAEILFTHFREVEGPEKSYIALQIMSQIAILVGILQLVAGVLRLGTLTQFVSRSVVMGYVLGTALAVVVEQLFYLTGIPKGPGFPPLYEKIWHLLSHVDLISWPTLSLGLISLALIVLLKRIHSAFPASLTVLVITALVLYVSENFYATESMQSIAIVKDIGGVHSDFLTISFPRLNLQIIGQLLPSAFALALLGMLESTSISRTLAVRSGQKVSINQDVFGLGMGNIASCLFGGMPASGSLSRSIVNWQTGARSRFSAILSAAILFGMILLLNRPVSFVPLTALSALLLIAVMRIIDHKQLTTCIRSTRADAIVLVMTLFSCILFGLDIAFYIGIVLSITLYLKSSSHPTLDEFLYIGEGRFRLVEKEDAPNYFPIRVVHVEGDLFFGASDIFLDALRQLAENGRAKVIILRLKNAHNIDATACIAMGRLREYLLKKKCSLLLSGVTPYVYRILKRSGLLEELGEENIFVDSVSQFGSTTKAYHHAEKLLP